MTDFTDYTDSENGNPYEQAYQILMDYWDSFTKEQKQELNKDLNKIFGKDHKEYVEVEE